MLYEKLVAAITIPYLSSGVQALLMTTYAERILAQSDDPIYLVTGRDGTGYPAWYYVLVKAHQIDAFEIALTEIPLRLTEYGIILASGYGEHPPAYIHQQLAETYRFDE
jgi:hypothetical protein